MFVVDKGADTRTSFTAATIDVIVYIGIKIFKVV